MSLTCVHITATVSVSINAVALMATLGSIAVYFSVLTLSTTHPTFAILAESASQQTHASVITVLLERNANYSSLVWFMPWASRMCFNWAMTAWSPLELPFQPQVYYWNRLSQSLKQAMIIRLLSEGIEMSTRGEGTSMPPLEMEERAQEESRTRYTPVKMPYLFATVDIMPWS